MKASAAALLCLLAVSSALASVEDGVAQQPDPEAAAPVVVEPPPPRTPRPLEVDMGPFQEAYDQQLTEAQQELTGQGEAGSSRLTDTGSLAFRAVAVLLAICGIIVLLGYFARRYGAKTPLLAGTALGRPMGRLYLDPKTVLHFVETGGRVLVIGASPGAVALITEFEAERFKPLGEQQAESAPASAAESAFVELLRQKQKTPAQSGAPTPDIETLRGDIQRLKEFLRESQRGGA
ncbi:MAG: hypothetical protein GC168_06725 [Candidatus Hydrogenedens sp.]|nr:hypothetical protein [Candidatus Hydrogenedens sp.]